MVHYQNLKNQWVPLWVKRSADKSAGNSAIVKAGAVWVSANIGEVDFTVLFSGKALKKVSSMDLFNQAAGEVRDRESSCTTSTLLESKPKSMAGDGLNTEHVVAMPLMPDQGIEFYELFLLKIQTICSDSPKTPNELADALNLHKSQLTTWLKKAVADKRLKKLTRPVRYHWVIDQQSELTLLT